MKTLTIFLALSMSFLTIKTNAQNYNFGKVSKQELQQKFYPLDSTAPAAVLYKNVKVYYDYSSSQGFMLITEVQERIKIYNKEGLDWTKKTINTYRDGNIKESANVKGYTYNLDGNNNIIKEKLKRSSIFDEKKDENWTKVKFTMPNAQVGSVVEWTYKILSPFYGNIDDIYFQYEIPMQKIVAKVAIPQYFTFKYMPSFYYPISIVQSRKSRVLQYNYTSSDGRNNTGTSSIYEIVYSANQENIPAIKAEPLINYIGNYVAKVHFEHTSTQFPNDPPKFYSTDWESVANSIFKNYYFGKQLEGTNFLKSDVQNQITGLTNPQEKAAKLFHYIKSQIKWDGNYGKYAEKGIKSAYQNHAGNDADINLCLVAMFRAAGLKANPVLISTKAHGIPLFPTLDGFNYVIAAVEFPTGIALFDATEIYSTPNVLPTRVINWQGRLIRDDGTSTVINMFAMNPAKERINLYVKMNNDGSIKGMKRSNYFNNYALYYRKNKAFLAEKDLLPTIEKNNKNIEISDFKILNKDAIYKPIVESFKFDADNLCDVIGDKIYFSPLFVLAENNNPFTLEKRLYPVDFGYAWEDNYIVSIQIPDGYAITTLPENLAIGLPNNAGYFKFVISKKGTNKIELLAITKLNTPVIPATEYQALKQFYKQLVEKETEKVVLTKIVN